MEKKFVTIEVMTDAGRREQIDVAQDWSVLPESAVFDLSVQVMPALQGRVVPRWAQQILILHELISIGVRKSLGDEVVLSFDDQDAVVTAKLLPLMHWVLLEQTTRVPFDVLSHEKKHYHFCSDWMGNCTFGEFIVVTRLFVGMDGKEGDELYEDIRRMTAVLLRPMAPRAEWQKNGHAYLGPAENVYYDKRIPFEETYLNEYTKQLRFLTYGQLFSVWRFVNATLRKIQLTYPIIFKGSGPGTSYGWEQVAFSISQGKHPDYVAELKAPLWQKLRALDAMAKQAELLERNNLN